jgi:methionyl-tRNA formyltransferase
VQRALLDGAEVTGVTTFVIDAGMDTGPMLLAAEVPSTAARTPAPSPRGWPRSGPG